MVSNCCIEIQSTAENRPSVLAWFAEVVIMARYLATNGLLEALAAGVFGAWALRELRTR